MGLAPVSERVQAEARVFAEVQPQAQVQEQESVRVVVAAVERAQEQVAASVSVGARIQG